MELASKTAHGERFLILRKAYRKPPFHTHETDSNLIH